MQKLLLIVLTLLFLFSCASKEETKCKEEEGINKSKITTCKFLNEWVDSGVNLKTFMQRKFKTNVYKNLEDCSEKTNESKEEKEDRESRCDE